MGRAFEYRKATKLKDGATWPKHLHVWANKSLSL